MKGAGCIRKKKKIHSTMETSWRVKAAHSHTAIPHGKTSSPAPVGRGKGPSQADRMLSPTHTPISKVPWHYITVEGLVPSSCVDRHCNCALFLYVQ